MYVLRASLRDDVPACHVGGVTSECRCCLRLQPERDRNSAAD